MKEKKLKTGIRRRRLKKIVDPIKLDYFFRKGDFIGWLALKHHRTHKNQPLDFKNHKYLIDIYKDYSPYLVLMKSTQNGCTEYLIIRAFAKAILGWSIFYVSPTRETLSRFVRNRIDKVIHNTEYYRVLAKEMAEKQERRRAMSVSLKEVGNGVIAIVSSMSASSFSEFPADELICDELDRCDQSNIQLGIDRLAASKHRTIVKVGNPTVEGFGISDEFTKSDKKLWYVKGDCGHWNNLDWFVHFVRDEGNGNYVILDEEWERDSGKELKPICNKCYKPFDRKGIGTWVSTEKNNISGYHITKLFSGETSTLELLNRFEAGLSNDDIKQDFYNADLGLPYTAQGAKITETMLDACVDSYRVDQYGNCIMGVDVGKVFHVIILRIAGDSLLTVYIGTVQDEQDVMNLYIQYGCVCGVIDMRPETRISRKICRRLQGMFMCDFSPFGGGRTDQVNASAQLLVVDRTVALDTVKEAFLLKTVKLPLNARTIPDFYAQMTASTRVYKSEMNQGRGGYIWTEGSKADHYFLAMCYVLLARKLLVAYQDGSR